MPKLKKDNKKDSPKLYHGTTETIAKVASAKGLMPYDVDVFLNGFPRSFGTAAKNGICLTSVYPGLMAHDLSSRNDRWGIIEIDVSHLNPNFLLPYEGYLAEKSKFNTEEDRLKKMEQLRHSLLAHKKKWRESLDKFGFCVYEEPIPVEAISRVTIFDPNTNWMMARAAASVNLGSRTHPSNLDRHFMITRWLTGDHVTVEEWVGPHVTKMSHTEKDKIAQILQNKNGLDIFHAGTVAKKVAPWW